MTFWGEKEWDAANLESPIVDGFEDKYLKDGCYRIQLGNEALVSVGPTQNEKPHRQLRAGDSLSLEPGQFAYLITAEKVQIPKNAMGLINMATAEKIKGLVNISGFHVDSGYSGKLIFTVFNAGASSVSLRTGQRLFRLWLCDYNGTSSANQISYDQIPVDWADRLTGAYPSPFALATQVREIETQVAALKNDRRRTTATLVIAALFIFPFMASLLAAVTSNFWIMTVIPRLKAIWSAI